ncbi:MAG: TetR/AcrR family transcriptional regulator [Gemmatimonadaceae bacterium]|jgi:AcrR family transcriptional regulator
MDETTGETRADRMRLRSAARREAERHEIREKVLEIARNQLLANGANRFSLREVAEEAGYTPTALYHYFADRDALLLEVARDNHAQLSAVLHAASASASTPRDRLLAIGQAYVRFAIDYPSMFRLLFLERPDLDAGQSLGDVRGKNFILVMQLLGEMAELGEVRSPDLDTVGIMLWAGVHGLATMAVTLKVLPSDVMVACARMMSATQIDALRHV